MADQAYPSAAADRLGVSGRDRTPAIPPADTVPLDATAHLQKGTADTSTAPRTSRRAGRERSFTWVIPALYILFLLVPIYWLVVMSFKTNSEIVTGLTLWPRNPTLQHYQRIFTDPSWYTGYLNSIIYVGLNTVISICVALPAAYAFSRYRFLGDKHLFFWLLTNRMAPPAVFALPFFQLYSAVGLFDTHIAVALAHCLFNVPLAVWILEGFMSGVPKEIDETAYIDGYSFPRFFVKIFMPLIASGVGVAAFFCFMFSWVELLLARTLTTVNAKPIAATMTRTVSASGLDWGLLAAAGVLTIVPGALVIYFVRNYIAKGFALGRV
jgi:glycerol transport system permease protein